MVFDLPLPWTEAVDDLESLDLLPTHLSSREIRGWGRDIRERSLFSARTSKAQILQSHREEIGELISGETNIARVDLVLQTNSAQVANFAYRESGQDSFSLFAFPAYELVRQETRKVPRGTYDPADDWPSRWEAAGGEFYDGRMIARKDSDVWEQLGISGLFDDALDTAYPPFAFNSGYGWESIGREEAISLGVIEEDEEVERTDGKINEGARAVVADLDDDLLKAIEDGLKLEIKDDLAELGESDNSDYLRRLAGV